VINDYINHTRMTNTCLETASLLGKSGRPPDLKSPVEYRMPNPDALRMLRSAHAHLIHDDAIFRVTKLEFRKWLHNQRIPISVAQYALETHAGMVESSGRWAPYTPWRGPSTAYYQFDLSQATAVGAQFDFKP